MQGRLSFCSCVFSCYSIVALNVFQCANTGDVGMGSGGGGGKVCVGIGRIAEFFTSGWEQCTALPTACPGRHTAGTAKCGLVNV